MKFTVTQENLSQGLLTVAHVAARNTNLPVLNNVLLEAGDGGVKLSATNLEIGVSCLVRGKIERPGSFTVQSKLLADYVSLLPREGVELALVSGESEGGGALVVKGSSSETKMKGIPAADFPLIPQIERKHKATCAINDLRAAVSQVIFAVSQSETRPEINGVFLQFDGNVLTLTATDSYRLAERKIRLLTALPQPQKVIVPARALQELLRVLTSFKDPAALSNVDHVELYVAENQVLFAIGAAEIISRVIEGQYPDYQQIIPARYATTARVATGELLKATKTASLFSRSGIYDVTLAFSPERHDLVLSAANAQLGENTSRVAAEVTGQEQRIVLNYRYLLDGLGNIETEEVEFSLNDNSGPCVVRPRGRTDYLYLVMPIKQ
ncbi:MAG: DNA polymerase III subunit beta [Patescibacteria group bacterium]|nr:DNA polymerase III subunit beta [Patescibacteria group bacterium]